MGNLLYSFKGASIRDGDECQANHGGDDWTTFMWIHSLVDASQAIGAVRFGIGYRIVRKTGNGTTVIFDASML